MVNLLDLLNNYKAYSFTNKCLFCNSTLKHQTSSSHYTDSCINRKHMFHYNKKTNSELIIYFTFPDKSILAKSLWVQVKPKENNIYYQHMTINDPIDLKTLNLNKVESYIEDLVGNYNILL